MCTHPLVYIVPHGSRWVWISLPGLLIFPCKVSIVLYCHICPRVTLLTVLLLMWGFHFLSVNFSTEPELLALEFLIYWKMDSYSRNMAHENSPTALFFFIYKMKIK